MAFLRIFLLLVFVSSYLVHCLDHKPVKDELENDENLHNLIQCYFPTNHPASIVVDVHYSVICDPSPDDGEICTNKTDDEDYKDMHFRWMQSYINLIIRPELLQPMALYTFQTDTPDVNLTVNLTRDCCDIYEIENNVSDCEKDTIGVFGDVTANMQYYAKKRDSSTKLDDNLGYSAFVYNQNLSYCVSSDKKTLKWTHIFLTTANCLLALFFSIGTPTILAAVYRKLFKKMADPDRDWKYIVWAVAVVAFFLTIAMIVANVVIIGIINSEHIVNYNSFYNSLFILISYLSLTIAILLTFVATPLVVRYVKSLDTDEVIEGTGKPQKLVNFPVPRVLEICNRKKSDTYVYVLIGAACWFFTVFLQLISFHGVYMILGVMASPVVPLSRITFYVAAFFCLVFFMAFFFKFSDKSKCDELCDNDCCCFKKECCIYVPPVLSAFLLFAGVVMFGVFYFYLSTMINSQHNDDFFSMLSSFLPAVLLGFATFCGRKLMKCVNENKAAAQPQPAAVQPQPAADQTTAEQIAEIVDQTTAAQRAATQMAAHIKAIADQMAAAQTAATQMAAHVEAIAQNQTTAAQTSAQMEAIAVMNENQTKAVQTARMAAFAAQSAATAAETVASSEKTPLLCRSLPVMFPIRKTLTSKT